MKRKGQFLIELALALALFSALFYTAFKYYTINRNTQTAAEAEKNAQIIADGIMKNFKAVVNAYQNVCAPDGWLSPNCAGVNPFPIADTVNHRIYYQLGGSLTAAQKQQLVRQIEDNLLPACHFQTSSGNNYYFICSLPLVDGLDYILNNGVITTGRYPYLVDPLQFPVAIRLHYSVDLPNGGRISNTKTFNEGWLYDELKLETQRRFLTIAEAMKRYAQTRLTTELNFRSYPNGLPSSDDYYVPWIWEAMFLPDFTLTDPFSVVYTACQDSNCTNITRDYSHWTPFFDWPASRRIIENLVTKSTNLVPYCYDAFMNPTRIVPVANGCAGNLLLCPTTPAPPRPQLNYYSVYGYKPPFFGYVFTFPCAGANAPDWCKVKVVY